MSMSLLGGMIYTWFGCTTMPSETWLTGNFVVRDSNSVRML